MSSKGFCLLSICFVFTYNVNAESRRELTASNKRSLQAFYMYSLNLHDFVGIKLQEKPRFSIHSLPKQPHGNEEKSREIANFNYQFSSNLPSRPNKSISGGRVASKEALQGLYSTRGGKMLRISPGGKVKGVTRKNIDLYCKYILATSVDLISAHLTTKMLSIIRWSYH